MKQAVSSKDRQTAFKKRMRSAGFVQKTIWIHPSKLSQLAEIQKRDTEETTKSHTE